MEQVENPSTDELVINVVGCKPEKRSEEQISFLSDYLHKILSFLNVKKEDCILCAKSCVKLTYHQNQSILKLKQQVEYFYIILEGQVSLNYLLVNNESSNEEQLKYEKNQQQNINNFKVPTDKKNESLQNVGSQQQVVNRQSQRISEIIDQPKKNSIVSRYSQSQLLPYKKLNKFDYFGQISICLKQICQIVAQCTSRNAVLLAIPKDVFNSTLKFYFSYVIQNDIEFLETCVHFFKEWNKNLLKRIILFGQKVQLKRGNLLYNEGDNADSIFLIVEGEFSAFKQYTYAPSFLAKAELNDVEKIRTQTKNEIDNKKQQKSLKILMVGKGEMIGESELFLQQEGTQKRYFSVVTESQDALVIKMHHQIFKDLVLTDTNTKQNILNLHHQRMSFVEQKVKNQKQKLSQYMDFFFQSLQGQQMKQKSTEFLKNSLKTIDQLNKDQFNKFLKKAYNSQSPQKKQLSYPQNQNIFQSDEKNNQISIPTLNYIIDDKQNKIVTEQDLLKSAELNQNFSTKMKNSTKESKIYDSKSNLDTESKSNIQQDTVKVNSDSGMKYFNSFFYRYLDQKQNNLEEPLISVKKSRRQFSLENLNKNKQKLSHSPQKTAFSRQNSLILQKMNQIYNQSEKQTIHSTLQQTDCLLKSENQIISLCNLQRRQSPESSSDNKNKFNCNLSNLKVEEYSLNNYCNNSSRKNTLDSIALNLDNRQSSQTKFSPQLKNRKIVSQSSHLQLEKQDFISLNEDHKNNIQTERRQPLITFQYKSDSINEIYHKNEEAIGIEIKKKLQIPRRLFSSRASSTITNFKNNSISNTNSICLREQSNANQNENQIIFLNNCASTTQNTIEDKNALENEKNSIIKQLILPLETQGKDLNSEETPLIYKSTQPSTKNNLKVIRTSVYKNFNEIFNNLHYENESQASQKADQLRKSSIEFISQQPSKNLQTNCSGVIYKQGVKLSYYQLNQQQFSTKSTRQQNNHNSQATQQSIQGLYQLNNFVKSPSIQTKIKKNIHVNNSKSKSSFDVFDKILNSKLNQSPKKETNQQMQQQ
ncbi:cyclic nucleotide-binding domain protein (macronuclear) [Tetrahymena thermophila SB210]|uniref:Cyclic nucleotide-binding domain protein n=1 Tax=Tetrahymena thermophila (strain SB210) TaxID=312017 RepID=Q244W4_TETTS|nr:cyclic nucleotide-binding domain protein [Tetrahymena thermophila SB210]EAS03373.2 cyclic nucleotide-binding domain protein [Tetrahymena thermophila SB210]|eukprot:XP_001023618.2 cyclic nucleotide-binding domain protein [Tetrahymena thermophila SB210]